MEEEEEGAAATVSTTTTTITTSFFIPSVNCSETFYVIWTHVGVYV